MTSLNQWLLDWCKQLAATDGSIALHESLYMYPLIETSHVLSLCLFVGTLVMVDLRLLGVSFRGISLPEMSERILPYTLVGFIIMVITGVLLFYAIPVRTYQSLFFRIKVILLIVAGINALIFHLRMRRWQQASLATDRTLAPGSIISPLFAKTSAVISLTAWAGVIVTGRMIAYNWFDCDKTDLGPGLSGLPAARQFNVTLFDFFDWLELTPIGTAIRDSLWLFPVIEAVHLLGLALLGGAVLVLDLRMLGLGLTRQS